MFGNTVIFDVIRDRLENSALIVNISGDTYRGGKASKLASRKKDDSATILSHHAH